MQVLIFLAVLLNIWRLISMHQNLKVVSIHSWPATRAWYNNGVIVSVLHEQRASIWCVISWCNCTVLIYWILLLCVHILLPGLIVTVLKGARELALSLIVKPMCTKFINFTLFPTRNINSVSHCSCMYMYLLKCQCKQTQSKVCPLSFSTSSYTCRSLLGYCCQCQQSSTGINPRAHCLLHRQILPKSCPLSSWFRSSHW